MQDDEGEPPLAVEINDVTSHIATEVSDKRPDVSEEAPPVGVTVITGYLGAGKSTVIPLLTSPFRSCFSRVLIFVKVFLRLGVV